jgi:hypothetical protein
MTVPRAGGDFWVISRESVEKFNSGSQVWEHEGLNFSPKTKDGWQEEIREETRLVDPRHVVPAGPMTEKGSSQKLLSG